MKLIKAISIMALLNNSWKFQLKILNNIGLDTFLMESKMRKEWTELIAVLCTFDVFCIW